MTMDYLSTSTHPKLSKNLYVYCIIPSSLFSTIFFLNRQKLASMSTELRASFCGILNELQMVKKKIFHEGILAQCSQRTRYS